VGNSAKLVVVVLVSVAALASASLAYQVYLSAVGPGNYTSAPPSSFTVNAKTYHFTYIAVTQSEREAGLMNTKITNATTMLFAFPSEGRWSFWMYDTNTSLDMIWINAMGGVGRVVYVVEGAPPCYDSQTCTSYAPASAANFVIEAKSGFAAENGVSIGTTIRFG
jgi:uncharacterized membrane protein (UPF0127 family)